MQSHHHKPLSSQNGPLILAHGAGAGMDSPFMDAMAKNLAQRDIDVERFNFPYMQIQQDTGKKRPPDRMPKLIEAYQAQIELHQQPSQLFIGGKSMGARVATLVACQSTVKGVVCLGFPFHAPGKPIADRISHFADLQCPVLIIQGERDPFGGREEISKLKLPRRIKIKWLADGNHDLKPRVKSGFEHAHHLSSAAEQIREFIAEYSRN